jgi:hypothetical protein
MLQAQLSEPLPAMYEIVNSFLKYRYLNQSFHALEAALGLLKNISISSLKETSLTCNFEKIKSNQLPWLY